MCAENRNLCRDDFGTVYYHNFAGAFPKVGCVEMTLEGGGKWSAGSCRKPNLYICNTVSVKWPDMHIVVLSYSMQ